MAIAIYSSSRGEGLRAWEEEDVLPNSMNLGENQKPAPFGGRT